MSNVDILIRTKKEALSNMYNKISQLENEMQSLQADLSKAQEHNNALDKKLKSAKNKIKKFALIVGAVSFALLFAVTLPFSAPLSFGKVAFCLAYSGILGATCSACVFIPGSAKLKKIKDKHKDTLPLSSNYLDTWEEHNKLVSKYLAQKKELDRLEKANNSFKVVAKNKKQTSNKNLEK